MNVCIMSWYLSAFLYLTGRQDIRMIREKKNVIKKG
jgi:hypothetical protein